MVHRRHDRPERSAVTLQFVGDNAKRNLALSLQELDKKAFRRATVTPGLDEDIDHVAVLIHCTPEILPFAVDRNKDFVQEPRITETALSSLQFPCVFRTELRTPLSDCFVRYDDPAFREQIFHIAKAQAEPIVMPDGVANDFRRESVSMIGGSMMSYHGFSLPAVAQRDNTSESVGGTRSAWKNYRADWYKTDTKNYAASVSSVIRVTCDYGGGGNRTRVRIRSTEESTCLSGSYLSHAPARRPLQPDQNTSPLNFASRRRASNG